MKWQTTKAHLGSGLEQQLLNEGWEPFSSAQGPTYTIVVLYRRQYREPDAHVFMPGEPRYCLLEHECTPSCPIGPKAGTG